MKAWSVSIRAGARSAVWAARAPGRPDDTITTAAPKPTESWEPKRTASGGTHNPTGNNGRLGGSLYAVYGFGNGSAVTVKGEHGNGYEGGLAGPDYGAMGLYQSNSGELGTPNFGVFGNADASSVAVQGTNGDYFGALGGQTYGVHGHAPSGGYAGTFYGHVDITGNLSKGGGSFRIDHPLDPANKYLSHSFVESPDMMNVYNGNVILDAGGQAVVQLPPWFQALNRDFRYQLTCIGGFAPVYVAEEIADNRFVIAGGKAGLKVSWQVTGVRQDRYARANPIVVEQVKPDGERGRYLHPELYDQPVEKGLYYRVSPVAKPSERRKRPGILDRNGRGRLMSRGD